MLHEVFSNDVNRKASYPKRDEVGRTFGTLKVVSFYGRGAHATALWLCQCVCGNSIVVRGDQFHIYKSCGCLPHKKPGPQVPIGSVPFNTLYNKYADSSKRKNRSFDLSKDQFKELTQGKCVYCGVSPSTSYKVKNCYGEYIYNGIDRVDSSKGYTLDNVVTCCSVCNKAKMDMDIVDFYDWIERVVSYYSLEETC